MLCPLLARSKMLWPKRQSVAASTASFADTSIKPRSVKWTAFFIATTATGLKAEPPWSSIWMVAWRSSRGYPGPLRRPKHRRRHPPPRPPFTQEPRNLADRHRYGHLGTPGHWHGLPDAAKRKKGWW